LGLSAAKRRNGLFEAAPVDLTDKRDDVAAGLIASPASPNLLSRVDAETIRAAAHWARLPKIVISRLRPEWEPAPGKLILDSHGAGHVELICEHCHGSLASPGGAWRRALIQASRSVSAIPRRLLPR
jgi:hypothetical protein